MAWGVIDGGVGGPNGAWRSVNESAIETQTTNWVFGVIGWRPLSSLQSLFCCKNGRGGVEWGFGWNKSLMDAVSE
jgi:hypothetical protein